MARVTYRGPGDSISFDGLEMNRGEMAELGENEVARLLQAGCELEIDREHPEPGPAPRHVPRPPEEPAPQPAEPAAAESAQPVSDAPTQPTEPRPARAKRAAKEE